MAIFRLAIGLLIYLICGGNAMIISFYQKSRSRISHGNRVGISTSSANLHSSEDFLELLILGKITTQIYSLFKEYCEKELSLENVMLMEKLVSIKKRDQLFNLKQLNNIYNDHLDNSALYAVNISHKTKQALCQYISNYKANEADDATSNNTTTHEQHWNVLNPIYLEALENMRDTFSRFRNTGEFKEWTNVYSIQQELHIHDNNSNNI